MERPYKLCDFKTAYGYIFNDLFEGYDYWGYYDIDTIWGNILKFIPDNADNHWIKIFPCGHLSFVRNIMPYTEAFRLINGKGKVTWEKAFTTPESHFLDEHGGFAPLFKSQDLIGYYYRKPDFDNICPPKYAKYPNFQSINYPEKSHFLVISYDKGHIYRNYLKGIRVIKEEISYLHISQRKMDVRVSHDSDKFIIYPNCFSEDRKLTFIELLLLGSPSFFALIKNIKKRLALQHILKRINQKLSHVV